MNRDRGGLHGLPFFLLNRIGSITQRLVIPALILAVSSPVMAGYAGWTVDGGPFGGRVHVILEMPDDPRSLYIGTERGGIFHSDGDGSGWMTRNNGLVVKDVLALAADYSDPDSMFAGTGGGGVYRSANRGDSWFPVNSGLPDLTIPDLTFAFDGGRLFAATASSGIYYTDNRGTSWSPANTGLTEFSVRAIAQAASSPLTWYAATDDGVFRSTDGGMTWTRRASGLTTLIVTDLLVHPTDSDRVYAGTAGGGVFKTTDGGSSWNESNLGMGSVYIEELVFDPATTANIWAATRSGIFGSFSAGLIWVPLSSGLTDPEAYSIAWGSDSLFTGSYWGGVDHTANPVTGWSPCSDGLTNRFVWEVVSSPHDAGTAWAASYGGVSVTSDTGWTWAGSSAGMEGLDVRSVAMDPNDSSKLLAGAFFGGVYRSIDGGGSWNPSSTGIVGDLTVTCLVYKTGSSTEVLAGTYSGPHKSTDSGATWSTSWNGMGAHKIWGVATTPADPSLIYAGTYGDGLFRSNDFAGNWTEVPVGDDFVRALAIHPSDPSIVYAGGYYQDSGKGGVYKSINGGAGWTSENDGLTDLSIWALAIDPADPDHLFAATLDGIFESRDGADNWTELSDGLITKDVRSIAFLADRVIAGTFGGSVPWFEEATVSVLGPGGVPIPNPLRITARPNPFNPRTVIEAGPVEGEVRLTVHDLAGRLVRVLFDGPVPGGSLSVSWDGLNEGGRPVPSGIYFGSIQTDSGKSTRRLVLLR